MISVSFYCKGCDLDQDLEGEIRSVSDWTTTPHRMLEYFYADCEECGGGLVRHVTGKESDPYFLLSKKLRIQRKELAKDLVQYGEEGFEILYKDSWNKLEEARETYELKQKEKRKAAVDFYDKYSHTEYRDIARKLIEKDAG